MVDIVARLNLGPLERWPLKFIQEADAVVRKTAFKIERTAKLNCPVDTGALRASIYTSTCKGDGYQNAVAAAQGAAGKSGKNVDELVASPLPQPPQLEALVSVGMLYGVYVEYGSLDGKRAAKPFLVPAANSNKAYFMEEMKKAVQAAAQAAGAL